jgi:ribosomal-protein-alanine N-acetyltransferase
MTDDDLDAVTDLEAQLFPDAWSRQAFEESLADDSWGGLIAEHQEVMAGYAFYTITDAEAHLTNIAVVPEQRRKSVAKVLLDRILEVVIRRNCEYLMLEVRPDNRAAIAFYEKHGFTLMYRLSNYYQNPVEDALVMVRYLSKETQEG